MPECTVRRATWRRVTVRPARRSRKRLAGLPAAIAALLLALTACTSQASGQQSLTAMPQGADGSSYAPFASPSRAPAPEETARPGSMLPVYWLGVNGGNVHLYREFQEHKPGGDPIGAAVSAALASTPADPNYFSPWQPAHTVTASISRDNVITVDVSSDAFGTPVDEGIAYRAVQQLVYTATAAAASSGLTASGEPSSVVLLVDGLTGYDAFGHVDLGGRMRRDPSLVAPVWITGPRTGETIAAPDVVIRGTGVAPDSRLAWQVKRLSAPAARVRSGSVSIDSQPGRPGQYAFRLRLEPGQYEVRVLQPAAGETGAAYADTKIFAVR